MSLDNASDHSPPHWARPGPGGVTVYSQGTAQEIAVTDHGGGKLQLAAPASTLSLAALLAACEALTSHAAEEVLVLLKREDFAFLEQELLSTGAASLLDGSWLAVFPEMLWQVPDLWLAQPPRSYPQAQVAGPHGSHPLRPPKPSGLLYHRRIPWLQQTFSLRALDPAADLELFHAWMNDTRVAAFFEESGTLEYHRNYLSRMQVDPHMMPVFGCLDGRPFCYFELYWARENRIGAHYPAGDWDRGWHVLVGDPEARGADYITAWLPSLMHYMFLAEPRTQALVGEPAASHTQQLRNLTRSGFAAVKEFDFAHKRATLVRLEREHFFQARLWSRPSAANPGRPLQLSPFAQLKPGETR